MDRATDIGAWLFVGFLLAVGAWLALRQARQDRAALSSQIGGKTIRYRAGRHYRPRSSLWLGLMWMWLSVNAAVALLIVSGLDPAPDPAIPAVTLIAAVLFGLLCVHHLAGFVRTAVVVGTVLERKILYSGEDNEVANHWIAVDDGSPAIAGTPVSENDYARVVAGAQVRLRLTARGRQVKSLEVLRFPASVNPQPPRDTTGLRVTAQQAAKALRSPVEWVGLDPAVPNTRTYMYVPPGTRVVNGTALSPWLRITEAFDPQAADEVARILTADSKRKWHHGNKGVFQLGAAYLMTWGDGALLIEGHMNVRENNGIGRLAYTLKPPKR